MIEAEEEEKDSSSSTQSAKDRRRLLYAPEPCIDWKRSKLSCSILEQKHGYEISSMIKVQVAPDHPADQGNRIITCSFDGNINIYDMATQKCTKTISMAHNGRAVRCIV